MSWTNDRQGKQDFDTDLLSITMRYYPPNYHQTGVHSVVARVNFGVVDGHVNFGAVDGPETIVTKGFEAPTAEEVKRLAEAWRYMQIDRLRKMLFSNPC